MMLRCHFISLISEMHLSMFLFIKTVFLQSIKTIVIFFKKKMSFFIELPKNTHRKVYIASNISKMR